MSRNTSSTCPAQYRSAAAMFFALRPPPSPRLAAVNQPSLRIWVSPGARTYLAQGRNLHQPLPAVRLPRVIFGGLVSPARSADSASVHQRPPPARRSLERDRLHEPAAALGPVAGTRIHVLRPQAPGAVAPVAPVEERKHFAAANQASEGVVSCPHEAPAALRPLFRSHDQVLRFPFVPSKTLPPF